MTLETFFENFEHLADAPNGVQKLRELILQLAVQGKLVPQDSGDEPAAVLLETAFTEQSSSKRAGREDAEGHFGSTDVLEFPFNLPESWKWIRFGEICRESFYGPRFGREEYSDEGIPTIRTTDMTDDGEIVLQNPPKVIIPQEKLSLYKLEKGDLLITRTGSIGIMAVFREDFLAVPSAYLIRFRFTRHVSIDYLYYLLKSPYGQSQLGLNTTKQAQPNINARSMLSILLPLPPLAEQQRIVAKIVQLMAICDELEARQQRQLTVRVKLNQASLDRLLAARDPEDFSAQWERICDNFDLLYDTPETVGELRQAVLQLAVMGKLGTQNLKDEPINITNGASFLKSLAEEETPHDLPSGWKWQRIGEISNVVRGGSPRPAGDKRFYDGNIPFLKVADLTATEDVYLSTYTYSIKEAGLTKTRLVASNTLMLTNSGATLGVPKICTFSTTFNDGIAALLELHEAVDMEFVYYFLKSKTRWFREVASRGQGQPNLNTDIIKATVLGIPPLAEQKRIVNKINFIFSILDRLEVRLKTAQAKNVKLTSAMIQNLLQPTHSNVTSA